VNRAWRARAALLLVALLAACASKPQGTVVLLPDKDGRDTALRVTQDGRELLLDKPYAAAQLTDKGPLQASSSAEQVQAQFGAALAARPLPPQQFTLYFVEGKDEFTDESRRAFDSVFSEIAKRPVPDVLVIGHTDTVGTDAFNDLLSRQRAEVVRRALVARGIAADNIVVVGRGKREPIVPTADGVAEARNRRVEILVR
jgi:outer membrane protein OmpA-like peptidoglycan-associated protein